MLNMATLRSLSGRSNISVFWELASIDCLSSFCLRFWVFVWWVLFFSDIWTFVLCYETVALIWTFCLAWLPLTLPSRRKGRLCLVTARLARRSRFRISLRWHPRGSFSLLLGRDGSSSSLLGLHQYPLWVGEGWECLVTAPTWPPLALGVFGLITTEQWWKMPSLH